MEQGLLGVDVRSSMEAPVASEMGAKAARSYLLASDSMRGSETSLRASIYGSMLGSSPMGQAAQPRFNYEDRSRKSINVARKRNRGL